jgi:cysteine synthase A
MSVYQNVAELIGGTKILQLNNLAPTGNLYAKIESTNPGWSVKDRISWSMVRDAEEKGLLQEGGEIVEATSGNTGVGLAMVAAARGYRLTAVIPETMSIERRKLMAFYGAKLVLTPGPKGMKGAISKADELVEEKGAWTTHQFENPANPQIHYRTTGPEIFEATEGGVDIFVSGVGTGGTITGAGKYLKEQKSNIQVVAVEPEDSPVLSGGQPGPHKIQGIGAGFIPQVLDVSLIDEIQKATLTESLETAKDLAKREGVAAGISSGAALAAAKKVAANNPDKNVVVILPDTGERYLSTVLFEDIQV